MNTYIAPKYKSLTLVKVPMGLKDSHGNKIKSVHIVFKPSVHGTIFQTKDPDLIKWLDGHECMKTGKIQAIDVEELEKLVSDGVKVAKGGVSTNEQQSAPEDRKGKGNK